MKTSNVTRTHKTRAYKRRKLIEQKMMGIGMIVIGIMCAVLDPQEGGAGLIMIGGLGTWLLVSRKQLIY